MSTSSAVSFPISIPAPTSINGSKAPTDELGLAEMGEKIPEEDKKFIELATISTRIREANEFVGLWNSIAVLRDIMDDYFSKDGVDFIISLSKNKGTISISRSSSSSRPVLSKKNRDIIYNILKGELLTRLEKLERMTGTGPKKTNKST